MKSKTTKERKVKGYVLLCPNDDIMTIFFIHKNAASDYANWLYRKSGAPRIVSPCTIIYQLPKSKK